jgi:beta-N-acetylhexosaminidase
MRYWNILIVFILLLASCGTAKRATKTSEENSSPKQGQLLKMEDCIAMSTKDLEEEEPPSVGREVEKEKKERRPAEPPLTKKPEKEPGEEPLPEYLQESEVTPPPGEEPVEAQKLPAAWESQWEAVADHYLNMLTLEQKIGQRFIAHIEGREFSEKTEHLIRQDYVAGIILYPWNADFPDQVKKLTSSLQDAALGNAPPLPLFICADQEGGRVNAFKFEEMTRFPSPYYWAQYDDPLFVESAAYVICREISELGCNMNLAPVLDVYGEPDRTIIGDRSMGADPNMVGAFGLSYLKGAERAGIISVVKHFPGHGSTTTDSHLDLPVVEMNKEDLFENDFKPFRIVIENGADAVMTSHVLYSDIDPDYPATLSTRILRDILREQLGFQGVIISDGISMGALSKNFDLTETLKRSFAAGVDLILVHSKYDLKELKRIVVDLYDQGEISEEEINEGVKRVLSLKFKYGLLHPLL